MPASGEAATPGRSRRGGTPPPKRLALLLPLLALAAAPARAEDPATNAPAARSGIDISVWLVEVGRSDPAESGRDWVVRSLFPEHENAVPTGEKWQALFDGDADRIVQAAKCDVNVWLMGFFREHIRPNGRDAPACTRKPRLLFNMARSVHDYRPDEADGLLFSATASLRDDGSVDVSFSAGLPDGTELGVATNLFESAARIPDGQMALFGGAKGAPGRDLVLALSARHPDRTTRGALNLDLPFVDNDDHLRFVNIPQPVPSVPVVPSVP